ncbi:terminase [Pedobacter sp. BS3]|uniref:PBSX family phage terminase large subunit n=1 Tax=Pedobacter sp. BS3 TaxID=2567937 RepID=UPI0011EEB7CA|nr:terminase large subunit [Pedobacter sp. BS3]TZF84525.1 terminase [Pedobacter sp. BS3]
MFSTTPLYEVNLYPQQGKKILINQGGTWSAKTYSILQVLFTLAIQEPNQVITIVGQDIPNLKSGAIRDSKNIIRDSSLLQKFIKPISNGNFYNESEKLITFWNGSIIEFKSYTNEQDAKSGKRDYLFVNESNGISYPIYKQLALRTGKRIFLDYNPTVEFWVHDELLGLPEVQLIISDHRHNRFIPEEKHQEIENLRYEDYELFKVYGRGITGKLQGLIFRNYNIVDSIPDYASFIATGLDFGYTNDPTGCIDVYMANGQLWVDEKIYETGMTNLDIANRFTSFGWDKKREIIADSAEPKSIDEIKNLGGWKVVPAEKGPDSVKNSIDILKRYVINITRRSANTKKEFQSYIWKVDKATGKSLNIPVDFKNHIIDPLRYVALNKLSNNAAKPTKRAKFNF